MLALPFRHARHDPETRRLRRVRPWWRPRHWWWLPLIGALGMVAISSIQLGMTGSQLVGARDDLLSGRFAVAENEFSQARDGLHNNPLLDVLRVLPPARRQLEALGILADIEALDGRHLHRVLGVAGDPKYVAPPAPLTRVLDPGDSWELRDENFSPDFPTTARQAEFFLARETGRRVEGVIAVDPYLVADLLSITGPVTVPQTGDVLTSQNVFETTLRRVELHRGPTPRKSFLSEATTAVLDRLKKMPAGSWMKLANVLQRACSSKDIQAYFDDPAAEALVDRFSCGGQVPVFRQDGLMVVDTNLNSNKDDFWITRSFSLDIQRS